MVPGLLLVVLVFLFSSLSLLLSLFLNVLSLSTTPSFLSPPSSSFPLHSSSSFPLHSSSSFSSVATSFVIPPNPFFPLPTSSTTSRHLTTTLTLPFLSFDPPLLPTTPSFLDSPHSSLSIQPFCIPTFQHFRIPKKASCSNLHKHTFYGTLHFPPFLSLVSDRPPSFLPYFHPSFYPFFTILQETCLICMCNCSY
ncbi:MAG: hypothetical protein JOS17DRAFT_769394 [Linnemannia elongata]|nr:MAG: hypothetical protein JOS17DRAFT_769394 [Linnemannia elongata]